MKKNTISRLISCLASVLAISPVFAQSNGQAIAASFRSPATTVVRSSAAPAPAAVDARVQRSFVRSFRGIETPHWYAGANCYVAEFKKEGRRTLATFDKKGYLACTVVYGTEKDLPAAERRQLQSAYRGYEIVALQEIIRQDTRLWTATLKSCKDIVKVQLLDGELTELEQWQRN